ncbi:DUF6064 family protein [Cupriavidus sp. amp6]|uniref:DUF6064 family protein n=1 Tax=Cupriavidus sp. amp6 TaxID=388051 RepID=UPI000684A04A|nr:DUF6064 family protein [Cupriavidus sp. amp6]
MLPFSRDEFARVFVDYNLGVWPAQVVAYLLGGVAIAALVRHRRGTDRTISTILAAMWIWTGIGYHWLYFSAINKAAIVFGAAFVLQGILLGYAGLRGRLTFGSSSRPTAWLGWALLVYVVILYPLIGALAGHAYPAMPMFGITPCPVTLFTFGMLLLTVVSVPRWLLIVPFLWSLIGGSAAFLLGIPQDWPLVLSGAVTVALVVLRDRRMRDGLHPAGLSDGHHWHILDE